LPAKIRLEADKGLRSTDLPASVPPSLRPSPYSHNAARMEAYNKAGSVMTILLDQDMPPTHIYQVLQVASG